jgi:hypothetical protein
LYVGIDKQIDAIVNLRESALCISLRCIRPEKSPWRDAKKILEKSIQSDLERSELTPAKHESSANAGADSKELTALDDAKPCQIKTNPILMDQTIMETVKTFAFDSESPSIKKFFSILIVGAEGSGKTFCCNEIEKIVDEKVDGKICIVGKSALLCDILNENFIFVSPFIFFIRSHQAIFAF